MLDTLITEAIQEQKNNSAEDMVDWGYNVDILKRCLHRTFIIVDEEYMDKMEAQQVSCLHLSSVL